MLLLKCLQGWGRIVSPILSSTYCIKVKHWKAQGDLLGNLHKPGYFVLPSRGNSHPSNLEPSLTLILWNAKEMQCERLPSPMEIKCVYTCYAFISDNKCSMGQKKPQKTTGDSERHWEEGPLGLPLHCMSRLKLWHCPLWHCLCISLWVLLPLCVLEFIHDVDLGGRFSTGLYASRLCHLSHVLARGITQRCQMSSAVLFPAQCWISGKWHNLCMPMSLK